MNGCWKKLWKECVNDFAGFKVKDTSEVRMDIMRLSHLAGFKEVNEDDIQELLDSHDEPLTNEDLMQLEQERAHNEDDDANKEEETVRGLDVKTLKEVFSSVEHAMDLLKEHAEIHLMPVDIDQQQPALDCDPPCLVILVV
ncbi:hypothetical protein Pmani_000891 [Petrolisthes manimaculis]|uniref:Uncharacterized protein n=1 Tax=Petrolisthes manimaculis TaxID=1843537 RepID=A0AAE1QL47_9EUCA|nr:hypothetical protein Pmani_000891 [Petrolisthes manimaculis]